MPAAAQAVGPRYPVPSVPSGPSASSSPNSRPCSPACMAAVVRARSPDVPLSPFVAVTPTSDEPVSHARPGGTGRQRSAPARREPVRETRRTRPSRRAAEVLGRDRIEELAELLDLVFLLVRDRDARLVEDLLAGVDLRSGPQRKRDRVRRARADLLAVREHEVGEVDPV